MVTNANRKKQTVYTSEQVRELDRIAIEDFGTPGYGLMIRAAQATFDIVQLLFPQAGHLCVICGAGNNAGDGYVLARLALQAGWQITAITVVSQDKLKGDALRAYQDLTATGVQVNAFAELPCLLSSSSPYTLVADALLGTGLQREVDGVFAEAISWINEQPAPVLALDIPSGLDADTGCPRGCAVKADDTVTYIGRKQGLLTGQARDYVGKLYFDDLSVGNQVFAQLPTKKWLISEQDIVDALPPRPRCSHKGTFGHSLLVGGAPGMSGAIKLAGEAALRTGSGLVRLATHSAHAAWLNQSRPELMVTALDSANELRLLLSGKTALGLGPGLGQENWGQELFLLAIEAELPMVMDADALNFLARLPRRQNNWILTPHPAEAARLLGCDTATVEQDRVRAVQHIQQQFGGVCVLKGAGTLISDGEEVAFCTAGNPGMASGGMGDVLSGIITGLLAQGLSLFEAAYIGVQVHAMAADRAAIQGERGLIASDVIEQLRSVVNP
ncbi:MAG: NAD(P)H-hydrate dehydratase [Thiolinea sp.]